eukprot:15454053-Alexandrium_andersonii.AAC.1
MDCARAFSEIAAPAEGPGVPAVRDAIRGEGLLGPDPRAMIVLNSGAVSQVPEGWVGPEETRCSSRPRSSASSPGARAHP